MDVERLMTREVRTCGPNDSLQTPAQVMWDRDCGCVPVVDEAAHTIGMITDRDICMATLLRNAAPSEIPVEAVMSKHVHCCRPNDSVEAAEKLLGVYQIRRLPVVDEHGKLVGLISLNDIAREAERERARRDGLDVGIEGVSEALAAVCDPRPRRAA